MSQNIFAAVYEQLADHLATEVPALGWIDLDQSQLDFEQLEYALPYDLGVLLIDFEQVEWSDRGRGLQRGAAVLKFTLARAVAADTYQHSSQRAAALAKLELLGQLHAALNHLAGQGFGSLVRISSQKEDPRPGLWVYSMSYKCELTDAEGMPADGGFAENLDTQPRPTEPLRGNFVIQL